MMEKTEHLSAIHKCALESLGELVFELGSISGDNILSIGHAGVHFLIYKIIFTTTHNQASNYLTSAQKIKQYIGLATGSGLFVLSQLSQ